MAQIVVIGASKGIGLETVKAALAAGHHVRGLARSAASIPITDSKFTPIAGDATDRAALDQAIAGQDCVILTLGVTRLPDLFRPVTLFSKATRALVSAMAAEGAAKRLICVTGLGAGDSRNHGGFFYDNVFFPLLLKRAYDDKDVQEMIIRRSGLDWVIVRPGVLTNSPATGRYQVLTEPQDWRAGSIARADVAQFLVSLIDDRQYDQKTPLLIT